MSVEFNQNSANEVTESNQPNNSQFKMENEYEEIQRPYQNVHFRPQNAVAPAPPYSYINPPPWAQQNRLNHYFIPQQINQYIPPNMRDRIPQQINGHVTNFQRQFNGAQLRMPIANIPKRVGFLVDNTRLSIPKLNNFAGVDGGPISEWQAPEKMSESNLKKPKPKKSRYGFRTTAAGTFAGGLFMFLLFDPIVNFGKHFGVFDFPVIFEIDSQKFSTIICN